MLTKCKHGGGGHCSLLNKEWTSKNKVGVIYA